MGVGGAACCMVANALRGREILFLIDLLLRFTKQVRPYSSPYSSQCSSPNRLPFTSASLSRNPNRFRTSLRGQVRGLAVTDRRPPQ
jgi:hypothetical protein